MAKINKYKFIALQIAKIKKYKCIDTQIEKINLKLK